MQVPLHHLGAIVVFGNVLMSPFLLHRCAEDGRSVVWCDAYGRFKARMEGPMSGNVLLRRAQHKAFEDQETTLKLAERFVEGKVKGARYVIQRAYRDYKEDAFSKTADSLGELLTKISDETDLEALRGLEGAGASQYFRAFPAMLRVDDVTFDGRNRRPPRDPVNAVLSFVYSLLTMDCVAAVESVGLDPQIGFLHALRPGRPALALDLMEEFRHPFADRLTLSLFNRQQVRISDFVERPGGAVLMSDDARKTVLTAYQKRKQDEVGHPLVQGTVPIGLLPHIQARILARCIRGDLDYYVPYRWK
jgi:CRISPR-associated protein Cas1